MTDPTPTPYADLRPAVESPTYAVLVHDGGERGAARDIDRLKQRNDRLIVALEDGEFADDAKAIFAGNGLACAAKLRAECDRLDAAIAAWGGTPSHAPA